MVWSEVGGVLHLSDVVLKPVGGSLTWAVLLLVVELIEGACAFMDLLHNRKWWLHGAGLACLLMLKLLSCIYTGYSVLCGDTVVILTPVLPC